MNSTSCQPSSNFSKSSEFAKKKHESKLRKTASYLSTVHIVSSEPFEFGFLFSLVSEASVVLQRSETSGKQWPLEGQLVFFSFLS